MAGGDRDEVVASIDLELPHGDDTIDSRTHLSVVVCLPSLRSISSCLSHDSGLDGAR